VHADDEPPVAQPAVAMRDHVVVCGIDHLGQRTVRELRRRDERVVVVAASASAAADLGLDVPIVGGDARLERVLRKAGVQHATAIVLSGDDDLENLDAALAAQDLNPDIRIVIRMFDAELGRHLQDLFPNALAISSSAVAAPAFVSAAIDGEGGERFEIGGRILTALPGPTDGRAPARQDGVVHLPIARLHADRTVDLLPVVEPTEPGLLLVEIADPPRAMEVDAMGDLAERLAAASGTPRSAAERFRRLPGVVRDRLAAPERRLVKFGAVLVGLAVVSAVYFLITASLTPLDALAYAVTLLTGASLVTSIDPTTASAALKLYAIVLSIVGAAIVAVVYALITDAIIRSRLLQTLGRRTVPASIRDHVIVAGLGSIGFRVVTGIHARGVPVVAVEPDENGRFVAAARALDIPVVAGDARQPEVLEQLGLSRARALVAATSSDLVNLSAALNARDLRPDLRVVVRLFDPDFAVRVQRGFGIRFTRSVSHLAAPAFAAAALGSEVVATVPVGDRRVLLFAKVAAPTGSRLEGRTVASLDTPAELRVLAIGDPEAGVHRWHPGPAERIAPDEEIVVVATRAGLASVLDLARVGATAGG
jgi:Trk K+ transport system NAD-binding subunit